MSQTRLKPAGTRRHRADVYRNQIEVDAHGHESLSNSNWTRVISGLPCSITANKGVDSTVSHEIMAEYHGAKVITPGMRIVINSVAYESVYVDDSDGNRRELTVGLRRMTARDIIDYVVKIGAVEVANGSYFDLQDEVDQDAEQLVTITVINKSDIPLTIANVLVDGDGFSLVSHFSDTIEKDGYGTIVAVMETATTGGKSATVSFAANGIAEFPFLVNLYGEVV